VAAEHQRQGIGGRLLQAVCTEVDEPMWCNSRLRAVPFYSRHGWVKAGPTFFMDNQSIHQRMTWSTTEQAFDLSS